MTTLSLKEEIVECSIAVDSAARSAEAEKDWKAVHGDAPNPWSGASKRYEELTARLEELRKQSRGHILAASVSRLRELDAELEKSQKIREIADRKVAEMRSLPLIIRYVEAFALSRNLGQGYSFVQWDEWYRKNKPRTHGAPECLTFFESPAADPRLKFNLDDERKTILEYLEARGRSENALIQWTNLTQMRSLLLRERPELLEVV